ncbi:FCD domain-containing protein [Streptomyces sp. SID5914]|nr:FCD domain-containing protein [Streptomyces sp. SID5914]MZG19370.1 FCD domain-containing protein [Streptomyces sp. SID5914]
MEKRQGRSLGEDVYGSIRRGVLRGVYAPGERLRLSELARENGVSLSVVREAVARLASEQLLEATPQHGVRVRPLSITDLLDLAWTRTEIESLALRQAIAKGDLAWETSLVASHHTLAGTPMFLDNGSLNEDWMAAHDAFHAALAAGCGSARLLALRRQLFDASELYRYWANLAFGSGMRGEHGKQAMKEHKEILDAALSRDADRAVELITRHLQLTAQWLADAGSALGLRD